MESSPSEMIAQKEIAKALGISAVTVSRALRNHPDLARETRERILQKARELGYPLHRGQAEGSPFKRLGILHYDKSAGAERTSWGVVAETPRRIFSEIQMEAQKRHVEVTFEIARSEGEIPLMLRNRTVDGLVLMGRYSPAVLERIGDLPVLAVSNSIESEWLPRLVADNFRGMAAVTEHLIALGHRQILYVSAEGDGWSQIYSERKRGYLSAMQSHGLTPEVIHMSDHEVAAQAGKFVDRPALVVSSDPLAYLLQDVLRDHGKAIPSDCSLVSFDDNRDSIGRKLTTYSPDWELMGRLAADFLIQHSPAMGRSRVEIVVPGRLVVRDSTRAL